MDYAGAAASAKAAYDLVLQAAAELGIQIEPQAWQADYKAKSPNGRFVDGVDYPRFRP